MSDNYNFLEPVGTPPEGTAIRAARGINIGGVLNSVAAIIHPTTGAALIGQAVRAESLPVALSVEDVAALTASGGVTDAELRASAVPVSLASVPLAPDAATNTALGALATQTTVADILAELSTRASETTVELIRQAVAWTLAVSGPLTDTELRANPIAVSGSFTSTGLTDTELRAAPVDVAGPLTDTQLRAAPIAVSGSFTSTGLTDAELRATAVPVSGPATDAQLRATPLPISGAVTTGGLTDTQLRASAIPVSGTVGVSGTVAVSGPLTDTQLRASAIPVSLASIPLASDAATQTTLEAARVILDAIQTAVQGTLAVSGPLTDTQLRATAVPISGSVTTGGLTDTQLRATAVPVSGTFWQATQPVSAASLPLPTGAATNDTLASGVGLRPDDAASHGLYTLSATPGTVTSINVPTGARIALLKSPSAIIDWNVDADPVAAGSGSLTAGGDALAFETTGIILRSGATTLRLSSATASATVRVNFRGEVA